MSSFAFGTFVHLDKVTDKSPLGLYTRHIKKIFLCQPYTAGDMKDRNLKSSGGSNLNLVLLFEVETELIR